MFYKIHRSVADSYKKEQDSFEQVTIRMPRDLQLNDFVPFLKRHVDDKSLEVNEDEEEELDIGVRIVERKEVFS